MNVVDPPSFFECYPFDDSANSPVDSGVGGKIGDGNSVTICDPLPLFRMRGDVVCVKWRSLFRLVVCSGRPVSVRDPLFGAFGRVLKGE